MDERSVSHDQPFLARIYQEDVLSCLNFPNKEVHMKCYIMQRALIGWEVVYVAQFFKGFTGLKFQYFSGLHCLPAFPFNSFQIVAVCDFYTYVRYIQQGLVKADATEIYWELMRLRGQMALARLGMESTHKVQKCSGQC
ncbi:PREDICTED: rab-3A-interacting protein-like [Acropora digitifera]|uniref:rab-3A-interacting protein-like n=1 Tax=Acropora digitifera TaxID=70779 RepID=UPI00077B16C8|nr:PREDICTED: rab-3A-interacting protein-like [Acropora digitifera]